MTDVLWTVGWLAVLAVGIGACVFLHERGLATTYARDLLHIGTGIWVLGWPLWSGHVAPMLLVLAAASATALIPLAARISGVARRVETSFAGGDEAWGGLVLYTAAYAAFTAAGLFFDPFAAAAALLALSLGDGIGGAIGRRFGRHRFEVFGAKSKSIEGSLAVAVAGALGVLIAGWRFQVSLDAPTVAGLGAGAAVSEAFAPRGTDNLVVPLFVWLLALVVT